MDLHSDQWLSPQSLVNSELTHWCLLLRSAFSHHCGSKSKPQPKYSINRHTRCGCSDPLPRSRRFSSNTWFPVKAGLSTKSRQARWLKAFAVPKRNNTQLNMGSSLAPPLPRFNGAIHRHKQSTIFSGDVFYASLASYVAVYSDVVVLTVISSRPIK